MKKQTPTTTPRPEIFDPKIILIAAERLAKEVAAWLGDGTPIEDIIHDLVKATRCNRNGYELARELNAYYPDAELVDILDSANLYKYQAREKASEEWVKFEGLEAPEIGATVMDTIRPELGVGTVRRNWPDGRSTVSFDTLGHIANGVGAHGIVLEWERLEPIQ